MDVLIASAAIALAMTQTGLDNACLLRRCSPDGCALLRSLGKCQSCLPACTFRNTPSSAFLDLSGIYQSIVFITISACLAQNRVYLCRATLPYPAVFPFSRLNMHRVSCSIAAQAQAQVQTDTKLLRLLPHKRQYWAQQPPVRQVCLSTIQICSLLWQMKRRAYQNYKESARIRNVVTCSYIQGPATLSGV